VKCVLSYFIVTVSGFLSCNWFKSFKEAEIERRKCKTTAGSFHQAWIQNW